MNLEVALCVVCTLVRGSCGEYCRNDRDWNNEDVLRPRGIVVGPQPQPSRVRARRHVDESLSRNLDDLTAGHPDMGFALNLLVYVHCDCHPRACVFGTEVVKPNYRRYQQPTGRADPNTKGVTRVRIGQHEKRASGRSLARQERPVAGTVSDFIDFCGFRGAAASTPAQSLRTSPTSLVAAALSAGRSAAAERTRA